MLQAYLVLFQMELGVLRDLLRGLCKLRVALLLVPEAKQAKPQQSPNSSPDPEGLRAWSSSKPWAELCRNPYWKSGLLCLAAAAAR